MFGISGQFVFVIFHCFGVKMEKIGLWRKKSPIINRNIANKWIHYNFLSKNAPERVKNFEEYKADTGKYMNWRGHAFQAPIGLALITYLQFCAHFPAVQLYRSTSLSAHPYLQAAHPYLLAARPLLQ